MEDPVPDSSGKGSRGGEVGTGKVHLLKQVTLLDCVALIVGMVIGSGIFISPKGILANTGTVGWALIVWVICGIFSCVGALCYAELGASIDKSGGDYTYLRILHPILGFLRVWTGILAVRTVPWTVLSVTTAKYVIASLETGDCGRGTSSMAATKILACCILMCIFFINCWSVRLSRRIQVIFTVAKVIGLIIIIVAGASVLCAGHTRNFDNAFDTRSVTWVQFPKAFYSGLFAYSGWQFLPQLTEEIIDPGRNIPLSIIVSMSIVMMIYILTNIAYFAVLTPFELLASDAVVVTFAQRVLGPVWWIMPVFVAMSCIGSVNGGLFTTSRLFFVASREGQLPDILGMVHINRKTPLPAACCALPICLIMLISDDVYTLINYLSFSRWLFIGISVLAVPYFRWRYPELKRPFKVPILLPILFSFCAIFMVLSSILSATVEFAYGLLITCAGIPFYLIFITWKHRPEFMTCGMERATKFLQKMFFVVPQEIKTYNSRL